MSIDCCAVVLAAGAGTRLRPLTLHRPKALCPVDNVPLLERTLRRLAGLGIAGPDTVAVNACYLGEQIVAVVGDRARLSVEPPPALGTSGGVARLRDWIAGRAALVCNADAYLPEAYAADLLAGWDGSTVRMLVVPPAPGKPGEFGDARQWRFAGMSLLPWRVVETLPRRTGELVSTAWRPAEAAGALEFVRFGGEFFDCGTPADYLAANLHASGGQSVIGEGAEVHGRLTRSVVWPGGYVAASEHLVDTIRAARDITVPAHPDPATLDGPPRGSV
ncbi:MAG: nucleotidyltransferase family protein [Micromonosporaceae bacterium]